MDDLERYDTFQKTKTFIKSNTLKMAALQQIEKSNMLDDLQFMYCSFDQELILILNAPNKNCSRRHFIFLLLSFEENKA